MVVANTSRNEKSAHYCHICITAFLVVPAAANGVENSNQKHLFMLWICRKNGRRRENACAVQERSDKQTFWFELWLLCGYMNKDLEYSYDINVGETSIMRDMSLLPTKLFDSCGELTDAWRSR